MSITSSINILNICIVAVQRLLLTTLLLVFSASIVQADDFPTYKVKIATEQGIPIVGARVYGNHGLPDDSFTDTSGEFLIDPRDLDRKGSPIPLYLYFSHPKYKFQPAEIEINKFNCPHGICAITAIPTKTEQSAVVRMYFVDPQNRPVTNIKVALAGGSNPCGQSTDNYGMVYFATTLRESCNDIDADPNNDSIKVLYISEPGVQHGMSKVQFSVCPKQAITTIVNVVSWSIPNSNAINGNTIKVTTKNGLPLTNLTMQVFPDSHDLPSFTVKTNASGTVSIPHTQVGGGSSPRYTVIPIGRYYFLEPLRVGPETCPNGLCQLYGASGSFNQFVQSVKVKDADNNPQPGVRIEMQSDKSCVDNFDNYTDQAGLAHFPVQVSTDCSDKNLLSIKANKNGCTFQHTSATPFKMCPTEAQNLELTAHCGDADDTHTVSGRAIDPYGYPLASVSIINNGQLLAKTREDGSYSISVNNKANISLAAELDSLIFDPQQITINNIDRDKQINFAALTAEGGMPENPNKEVCAIADNYTISGAVFDRNGVRVPGVSIYNNDILVASTDEQGSYSFTVAAHDDVWVIAELNDELFYPAGYAYPVLACDKLQTNFQISTVPSFIQAGTVIGPDNTPIAEFELRLTENGQTSSVLTDANGYFQVSILEDKSFSIRAIDARYLDCNPEISGVSEENELNHTIKCLRIDQCINSPKDEPGVCGCDVADTDSDQDGSPDCNDGCPADPYKLIPGICGCGLPDFDSDGDGKVDCEDLCPFDAQKTQPGECGCGIADIDSDNDGVLDCNDACPFDSSKISPGACGCNKLETDSDHDNVPDCIDLCPTDSTKSSPGKCGCGFKETDSDDDGTPDCIDQCPNDFNKILPGICGCGVSDKDSDNDGTPDCKDLCPNDSEKLVPGLCGCGKADIDRDLDGILDCFDKCPLDPKKSSDPGICGCGVIDKDTDQDGTMDCIDTCYLDPLKTEPGACGCGVSDLDTDADGTPDCNDLCKFDPKKNKPGQCGCGVPDLDSDGDGYVDCVDQCPHNALKQKPGLCGCDDPREGDTDGDGIIDCFDECINDPLKTEPGACGCGIADVDSDNDGTLDCKELCPNDPLKTQPGICGCGQADIDTDGDGTLDCFDKCKLDPNKTAAGTCGCGFPETDRDLDGFPDCIDRCPDDALKMQPGACGCGVADLDSDGDNVPDCLDQCPNDPAKTKPGLTGCGNSDKDTDGDNTPDFFDGCPLDFFKTSPGACGCGKSDVDTDLDGTPDCKDLCPQDPNKIEPQSCGCGNEDLDHNNNERADCLEQPLDLVALCTPVANKAEQKVVICHQHEEDNHSSSMIVALSDIAHHLDHGDESGLCAADLGSNRDLTLSQNKKITICHIPPGNPDNAHTIEISTAAWNAHKAHGDYQGPCKDQKDPSVTLLRWKAINRNPIEYLAETQIIASNPNQKLMFQLAPNSEYEFTTVQIPGQNVGQLGDGTSTHDVVIHGQEECRAAAPVAAITAQCIDTVNSSNQILKWQVKNLTNKPFTGVTRLINSDPEQLQKVELGAGQVATIETKSIPGTNSLALFIDGIEVVVANHNAQVCPAAKAIIGGELKGPNGRQLSSKLRKQISKNAVTVKLRDLNAKTTIVVPFDEDAKWSTAIPIGHKVRIVLAFKNSDLEVRSIPHVLRKMVEHSSNGYTFAIRARGFSSSLRQLRSSNAR